jgi:hypothetical protein
MNQLLMFDDEPAEVKSPIARRSDPDTSHIAAAEVSPRLKRAMAAVESVMHREKSARTAQELAVECVRLFGGLAETYRKRARELVECHRAVECSVRRCGVTGKLAATFRRRDG